MADEFRYRRRVEFCETDAAGIAHFSSLFQYMEQAEHAFLRERGLSVVATDEVGTISWPRVSASCDFTGAIKFEQEVEVVVSIEHIGSKSVRYGFDFQLNGKSIASGTITSVCCRIEHGQPPRSIPIPDWMLAKLQPPQSL